MANEKLQNYYDILGISKNASQEDIKKSYRKLSLSYHPDKTQGDPVKTTIFTKIKDAYDILCDPHKRAEYDNSLEFQKNGIPNIFRGNTFDGHGGIFRDDVNIIPEEILSHLFMNGMFPGMGGGIRINSFHMKPQPIVKKIVIPFIVSYTGGNIPIEIDRIVVENGLQMNEVETIYVEIERGIDNDEIIVLEGKGNISQNLKGDVKIVVKVENSVEYERCGMNLKINKKITLKEALTGFQFALKHLNGNVYNINNSKGNIISHNFHKNIPGMGMIRGGHTGDMIIAFEVVFPEKLELDVIDKLEELL